LPSTLLSTIISSIHHSSFTSLPISPAPFFLITESHGLERRAEPVAVTASFYANELDDPDALVLLDEDDASVTIQISDVVRSPSTGLKTRESIHCRIHFLVDVPAYGRKKYRLEIGTKEKEPEPEETNGSPEVPSPDIATRGAPLTEGLYIQGEGLALNLRNRYLSVSLDPATGQIFHFRNELAGVTLDSPRTENWDPDYFDPNRGWAKPFDWHAQPKVTFEHGPIFFQLYRSGMLREFPEITLHVTYRLYAGAPYLWARTIVEINEDVPLACLRSEEFVFKAAHFTHLAWQETDGRILSHPLKEMLPINRHGDLVKLAPRTPWVGFADPENGHAIATLQLDATHFNRRGRPVRTRDNSSYLIKAESIDGVYWVRPLIYWPQHTNRDQLLIATAGSIYENECAYCVAATNQTENEKEAATALYAQFDKYVQRLRHPLYAEVEDEQSAAIRNT
jgi:hypothetical protein